jgi:hypothetical protein
VLGPDHNAELKQAFPRGGLFRHVEKVLRCWWWLRRRNRFDQAGVDVPDIADARAERLDLLRISRVCTTDSQHP